MLRQLLHRNDHKTTKGTRGGYDGDSRYDDSNGHKTPQTDGSRREVMTAAACGLQNPQQAVAAAAAESSTRAIYSDVEKRR